MTTGKTFDMEEEFAGLDFNSKRLEKRFGRTMKTLAKQPGESIWGCGANRAEVSAMQTGVCVSELRSALPQLFTACWETNGLTTRRYCANIRRRQSEGLPGKK